MGRHARLGTVDNDNLSKVRHRIQEKTLKHTSHGLSYIEDYQKGRDESTQAYGYLNALGYTYGYAMAEAYLEDFLHAEDPGAAAEIGAIVVEDLRQWENEVMGRVRPLDLHLVREAVKEVGHRMPPGPSPETMIDVGTHYRDGMYIRDFSYSVASALQLARNDVENFLAWHKVKYPVLFNEEANQYVPELLTDVSRDEYKRAIRETNAEIRKHTYYGMSNTAIPEHPNFSILAWSNGSESWHLAYGMIDPAVRGAMLDGLKMIRLDANYILVPFHPEIMKHVLAELDPLPLFPSSTILWKRNSPGSTLTPTIEPSGKCYEPSLMLSILRMTSKSEP